MKNIMLFGCLFIVNSALYGAKDYLEAQKNRKKQQQVVAQTIVMNEQQQEKAADTDFIGIQEIYRPRQNIGYFVFEPITGELPRRLKWGVWIAR